MDETEKQKRDLGVFMEETITIERMGYGSEAVGRLESGKAVFVEGGAPGDVAALADVLRRAATDAAWRRELTATCSERIATLGDADFLNQTLAVYADACSRRPRS